MDFSSLSTNPLPAQRQALGKSFNPPGLNQRSWWQYLWNALFSALTVGGALYVAMTYWAQLDAYDLLVLGVATGFALGLNWVWRPLAYVGVIATLVTLWGMQLYQGDIGRADQVFGLKYFVSSQTAVFWMSAGFFFANAFYWLGLLFKKHGAGLQAAASGLVWFAATYALIVLLMRWHESYLLGPDIGHIPVSNLYEVFVLFCLMSALFYLYFEQRYQTRTLGAFLMMIVSTAVIFLLWYSMTRDAHQIQPLIPALKSWWMKLHVPANFVGYSTFALASMTALAYLIKEKFPNGIMARLPSLETLDDLMYKAIAIGFAFFTIATVLGALWAAEAWGGYWSWDPKETWALVVWLNYAIWLHMRLVKGLRGTVAAWWALVGLAVTTFAFLGVNIFLSGLHSYGKL